MGEKEIELQLQPGGKISAACRGSDRNLFTVAPLSPLDSCLINPFALRANMDVKSGVQRSEFF